MIQYGSLNHTELCFEHIRAQIELRDEQWFDVELHFGLAPGNVLPEDIGELTALLICTHSGDIAQIVAQDEGRDCEYQFTDGEKEQLRWYYEQNVRPRLLLQVGKG